jgi:hypothetical protein
VFSDHRIIRLVTDTSSICDLSLQSTTAGEIAVTGTIDGDAVDFAVARAAPAAAPDVDSFASFDVWAPFAGERTMRYIGGCFGAGVVIVATAESCMFGFRYCDLFFEAYDYYSEHCVP